MIKIKNLRAIGLAAVQALLVSTPSFGATNPPIPMDPVLCKETTDVNLQSLDKRVTLSGISDIRAFYTLTGPHALHASYAQIDLNGNQIPDIVEDAIKHTHIIRKLFQELGYIDLMDSSRFQKAESIDINFMDLSVYGGNNARAGSAIRKASNIPNREGKCFISIDINSAKENQHIRVRDDMLPHEVFHLINYGYTQVVSAWFAEGVAHWAAASTWGERSLNPNYTTPLPESFTQLRESVTEVANPYQARFFWNRVAYLSAQGDGTIYPSNTIRTEKFADGSTVLENDIFYGHQFYLRLMQRLAAEDKLITQACMVNDPANVNGFFQAFNTSGWPEYNWSANARVSKIHDNRIIRATQQILKDQTISSEEINKFLAIEVPELPLATHCTNFQQNSN